MKFLFVGLMGCYMFSGSLSFILVIGLFNCTELTSNNSDRFGLRGPFLFDGFCMLASPKYMIFFLVVICVCFRQPTTMY